MPLGRESLTAPSSLDGDGLLPVEPESFPLPDGSGASDSLKSPWLLPIEPGLVRNVCDLPRPPPSSRSHIQPEGYREANLSGQCPTHAATRILLRRAYSLRSEGCQGMSVPRQQRGARDPV